MQLKFMRTYFTISPNPLFQHIIKHAISKNPLKTMLSLSYLVANFLNPIFNYAKNRSIAPLFM